VTCLVSSFATNRRPPRPPPFSTAKEHKHSHPPPNASSTLPDVTYLFSHKPPPLSNHPLPPPKKLECKNSTLPDVTYLFSDVSEARESAREDRAEAGGDAEEGLREALADAVAKGLSRTSTDPEEVARLRREVGGCFGRRSGLLGGCWGGGGKGAEPRRDRPMRRRAPAAGGFVSGLGGCGSAGGRTGAGQPPPAPARPLAPRGPHCLPPPPEQTSLSPQTKPPPRTNPTPQTDLPPPPPGLKGRGGGR
jgi:hypothetical protein